MKTAFIAAEAFGLGVQLLAFAGSVHLIPTILRE
jgi:hypothetical protein